MRINIQQHGRRKVVFVVLEDDKMRAGEVPPAGHYRLMSDGFLSSTIIRSFSRSFILKITNALLVDPIYDWTIQITDYGAKNVL